MTVMYVGSIELNDIRIMVLQLSSEDTTAFQACQGTIEGPTMTVLQIPQIMTTILLSVYRALAFTLVSDRPDTESTNIPT